MKSNNTNLFD